MRMTICVNSFNLQRFLNLKGYFVENHELPSLILSVCYQIHKMDYYSKSDCLCHIRFILQPSFSIFKIFCFRKWVSEFISGLHKVCTSDSQYPQNYQTRIMPCLQYQHSEIKARISLEQAIYSYQLIPGALGSTTIPISLCNVESSQGSLLMPTSHFHVHEYTHMQTHTGKHTYTHMYTPHTENYLFTYSSLKYSSHKKEAKQLCQSNPHPSILSALGNH